MLLFIPPPPPTTLSKPSLMLICRKLLTHLLSLVYATIPRHLSVKSRRHFVSPVSAPPPPIRHPSIPFPAPQRSASLSPSPRPARSKHFLISPIPDLLRARNIRIIRIRPSSRRRHCENRNCESALPCWCWCCGQYFVHSPPWTTYTDTALPPSRGYPVSRVTPPRLVQPSCIPS